MEPLLGPFKQRRPPGYLWIPVPLERYFLSPQDGWPVELFTGMLWFQTYGSQALFNEAGAE